MTAIARSPRLASSGVALALGGVVLALSAAAVPLSRLAHQPITGGGGTAPLAPAFATVGFLLAWKRPRNPLGWLLFAAGAFLVASGDASFYAVADYRLNHGTLPLGWLAMLAQPGWAPAIVSFGLAILLFPDGRLPAPRWRWLLAGYLALGALWIVGALVLTASAIVAHTIRVDVGGNLLALSRPSGGAAWWGVVQNLFFPVLGAAGLASLAAQAWSLRRSTGDRRQQLKWLMGGAAVSLAAGFLTVSSSGASSPVWAAVGNIAGFGLLALPVCVGVAILKYRLYDIDQIISRTLAYTIVTGLLVGVYAGLVLLITTALPTSGAGAVAVATLAAAAMFNPLRRRVQRLVDRRFNRARYDAERTVAAFATRLSGATDLDSARADLLATVRTALEPAHVSLWTTGGSG